MRQKGPWTVLCLSNPGKLKVPNHQIGSETKPKTEPVETSGEIQGTQPYYKKKLRRGAGVVEGFSKVNYEARRGDKRS